MISLINPENQFPGTPTPGGPKPLPTPSLPSPEDLADFFEEALAHNFDKAKAILWKNAIMFECGGEMPSDDEVRRRAQEVRTKTGVFLLWDHPRVEPGDDVDLEKCIASIDYE